MHASTKIIVVTGLTNELLPGDNVFISQPYHLSLTTYGSNCRLEDIVSDKYKTSES